MRVRLLSGQVFSHYGGQRSKVKVTRNKKHAGAYEWYALVASSVQQQRTGAFRGWRGMTSAACVCWRGSVGIRTWVPWLGGGSRNWGATATALLKAVWWDLRLASLRTSSRFFLPRNTGIAVLGLIILIKNVWWPSSACSCWTAYRQRHQCYGRVDAVVRLAFY